jgi:glutamine phosphoribosylpyrophosphate amidotransferase
MCGIVAYIGKKPATTLLLEGLKRLEYRGYDSAGVAVQNKTGTIQIAKSVGRVRVLEELIEGKRGFDGGVGIAHTRWATTRSRGTALRWFTTASLRTTRPSRFTSLTRATSSRARRTLKSWCT